MSTIALRLVALFAIVVTGLPARAATETTLHEYGPRWAYALTPFVEGSDGNLYGTGFFDGVARVYRLTPTGALSIVRSFPNEGSALFAGVSPLAKGAAGALWLTSRTHIYKLSTTGVLTTMHTFTAADGTMGSHRTALVLAADGKWYGSGDASDSGADFKPTIYRFDPATGTVTTLHTFADNTPATLIKGPDGLVYGYHATGTTGSDYATVFKLLPSGQLVPLHTFSGAEGMHTVGLVAGPDGNLYGVNAQSYPYSGFGRLFRMTPQGAVTLINQFLEVGMNPWGFTGPGLTIGADGNLYGMTIRGGAFDNGILYRANPQNGRLARLHAFGADNAAEHQTDSLFAPILAANGNLYGVRSYHDWWGNEEPLATAYQVADAAGPVVNITVPAQTGALLERRCAYARLLGPDNAPIAGAAFNFLRSGANPGSGLATANSNGLASHCWTATHTGRDTVLASAGSASESGVVDWSRRPVTLGVGGYVETQPLQQSVTVRPRAQMNDGLSGAAIGGRTIRFLSAGTELCRAVTAADGSASCKTTLQQNAQTLLNHQYSAAFDGDALYAPVFKKGALVCAGSVCN